MSGIRVVVQLELKPDQVGQLMPCIKELQEKSRAEAGNISYDWIISAEKPNAFFVVEHWKSQAALDEHMETAHFKNYKNQTAGKVISASTALGKNIS